MVWVFFAAGFIVALLAVRLVVGFAGYGFVFPVLFNSLKAKVSKWF